jgi:hypothetical protein
VIVELDGRVGHEGVGQFRDMDRDNRHALVDALTLRYGSYDLTARPCGTVHYDELLAPTTAGACGCGTC